MKSPFLILFIIVNLLTINMVSASSSYDEIATESHFISAQHEDSSSKDTQHDESACNHFCHISSHMVGLVSRVITPSVTRDSVLYSAFTKEFHSFIHTPPSQPPKA